MDSSRLLLVDDDPEFLHLAQRALEAAGMTVAAIHDATAAHTAARDGRPNLVLCDVLMPVMDGFSVLRSLQADPLTASLPVVFLTASREPRDRVLAFRFGVVDFWSKPVDPESLADKVKSLLRELPSRSGRACAPVDELEAEIARDARSGVLRLTDHPGSPRAWFSAGETLGRDAAFTRSASVEGVFDELDPSREPIVAPSPRRHAPGPGFLAALASLPAGIRNVLVVDDDVDFRRLLTGVLRTHGFIVHAAANAEDALREALARKPWLVVADVNMPGQDGFELVRRMRRHTLLRHTPIVLLSGWDDFKTRLAGLEAGADDYLVKGSPLREILFRIHVVMSRFAEVRRAGTAFEGSLDLVGVTSVLQMLHIEHASGVLTATQEAQRAEVRFHRGSIVGVGVGTSSGMDAIQSLLSWEKGRFRFDPGNVEALVPLGEFDGFLLEACRRLDERGRAS